MKHYIFGLLAIVIATTAVAFKSKAPGIKPTSYTFYFEGDPLIPSQVANESLWSITAPGNSCSGTQNKACQMDVEDYQTEVIDGERILKSALNIVAEAGASGTGSGYVPQLSSDITSRSSRP